ncbi:hypothetical protein [Calycomorphotria hydatis]|uniref:Uncharacterized protein n=1 Tax=Calycomorphotria hydatis TaxID=2528027 RepID=A0A517TE56_9PLAN|nr:hypothetical protein [Calycomorphotria hydatis]QDT66658.1 hypothetical protein V22_39290 [Calycomorphotria hydatis]
MPNARHKLNAAAINGVLLVAGLIALLTQSWQIFILLLFLLLVTSTVSGSIRPWRTRK